MEDNRHPEAPSDATEEASTSGSEGKAGETPTPELDAEQPGGAGGAQTPEEGTSEAAGEPSASEMKAPGGETPEGETTEAFAELLAEAGAEPQERWRKGEKVKARVVRVTDEWVFVSLGGKEEGSIRANEFARSEPAEAEADSGATLPGEGDEVEAYVLSVAGGEVILTTKLSSRDASLAALQEACQSGIPVEGRVVKSIKGGFEVRVAGRRAFCPLSQIDVRWPKDPKIHVGQTYGFKIAEFKEKGRNIIVSRRSLIEEERAKLREELKEKVIPGAVLSGTVRSVQNFGAFVDLGGVDALIPVSEMSWGRIQEPAAVLGEGQEVTAKVLNVDWDRDRISLSLKALEEDPWQSVQATYHPGERVTGTVARLASFGAFVTLQPGVDGLVHVSALGAGRRVHHPKEVLQEGEVVDVEIVSVDPENRKISLSMEHRYYESLGELPRQGDLLAGTVEKVADFGVFVKIPSGHTGLVPNVEMGTPRGTDHSRMLKPGDSMDVKVLGVEEGGKRIRLSRKAVAESREAEATQEYTEAQNQTSSSFGTLGDLLKAKMDERE